jgi:uncharacterized protein YqgV (UPF0045/DUF77 family)
VFCTEKIIKMTTLARQGNHYQLTFSVDLLSDKQIKKLMELIDFERLVRQNKMTEDDVETLSEQLKTDWWKGSEARILEKIKAYEKSNR